MASRLVTHGKLPYHDFLWTQMPLMPYIYGSWMRLDGMTWFSARTLSAILAALLGVALYDEVARQTGKWIAGLLAVLLFMTSASIFAWFTIVKTYTLSTLLLFLAYRIAVRGPCDHPSRWWIAAGMCLGLSVDVRLYIAGLLPVLAWWIVRHAMAGLRLRCLLLFCCGFALALFPNLYLFARDPGAYYFGNLGFHAIRSGVSLIGDFDDKLTTLGELVRPGGDGNALQMVLLLLTLPLSIRPGVSNAARLALILTLALAFICVLPTPTYAQYFCVTIPFLIVFAVCSMSNLLDALPHGKKRTCVAMACAVMAPAFAYAAIPDYRRFLETGVQVSGIDPGTAFNWRIRTILTVSNSIDHRIQPGEPVMSLWPGYVFQSKAEPYPGLENNSATYLAEDLSPSLRNRYHILSPGAILAGIAWHKPKWVVLGNQQSMLVEAEPYEKMLLAAGYRVICQTGGTRLWMRSPI